MVQSREALHRVDISVPETLQVIHKSCPSTYKASGFGVSPFLNLPQSPTKKYDANAWMHLVGFFRKSFHSKKLRRFGRTRNDITCCQV